MAVAHDAATESTYTTTSPHTFTHTPVGTPRGVVVFVMVNANENPSTNVFYGDYQMVAVEGSTDSAGEPGRVVSYFLGFNIPAGAQTVSVEHAGSATTKHVVVCTLTAARELEVVDSAEVEGDQSNPSLALDSGSVSALRYAGIFSGQDAVGSLSIGANQTAVHNHDFGSQVSIVSRQDNPSTGSFSMSWTATSEDVAFNGLAVGEVTGGPIGDATIAVEAAFQHGPYDTPGWWDLTDRCRSVSFSRGRNHELDRIEAGTASFLFDNRDGHLNADNGSSAFSPYVKPMVPIRVTVEYSGTVYPLWYGFVEGWPVSYPGKVDSVVTVTAVDLFKLLALEAAPSDFSGAVMDLDPDAYWRFTDNPGTTDTSGNSHTLTFAGTPTIEQAGVWLDDESVSFDGSDDAATVASETVLEYVDVSMSIVAWVKPDASASGTIMGSTAAGPSYSWGLNYGSSTFSFRDAGTTSSFNWPGTDAEWQMVAVTRDVTGGATTLKAYVNGELAAESSHSNTAGAATRTVHIGRNTEAGTFFEGDISEIALWGVALSPGEVSALYAAQSDSGISQLTSERIADLLTLSGFTTQDLETGQSTMATGQVGGSLLDEIQGAVDTEAGLFFITADGTARFHDRHYRLLSQSTPIDTFDDSGNLPYVDLALSYDDTNLWNEVTVTPGTDATPFTVTDSDSISSYGKRTLELTTYPADVNEGYDRALWSLGLYAEPSTRIDQITMALRSDSALWPVVLDGEIGNRYTFGKTEPGDDIEMDVYLEGIVHDINPQAQTWNVTWQLSPATSQTFWALGEAGMSELDETTILAF